MVIIGGIGGMRGLGGRKGGGVMRYQMVEILSICKMLCIKVEMHWQITKKNLHAHSDPGQRIDKYLAVVAFLVYFTSSKVEAYCFLYSLALTLLCQPVYRMSLVLFFLSFFFVFSCCSMLFFFKEAA